MTPMNIRYNITRLIYSSFFQLVFLTYLIAQPNYPYSVQVNSTTDGHQDSPELAVNSNGTVLVMFESDTINNDENILAVSYDRKSFKEFYHTGPVTDTPTLEAFPKNDKFVISWEQNGRVYFTIISCKNNNETFIVNPKPIRGDIKAYGERPDVAISRDGSLFVIGWHIASNEARMQFFDSTGVTIGDVIGVSDQQESRYQISLKFWPDSVLGTTWHAKNGEDTDIWFQIFDCKPVWNGGTPLKFFEKELRANGDLSSSEPVNYIQEYPEIDVFDDGRFAIMWQDFPYSDGGDGTDGSGKGAYFRIFNRDGTPQTEDIQISEHTYSFQKDADIRIRQSDATIHFIYEDAYESTPEKPWLAFPSYRVFNDEGQPLAPSIELSDKSYGTDCRIAITESEAVVPNLVVWVWESKDIENYDGSGRAVIFRDSSSLTSDVEELANNTINLPNEIQLLQNYPNPFNETTSFGYFLAYSGQVKFIIYNAIGQEVVTLINEFKQAGFHRVRWEAINLSSGIYYYSIKTSKNYISNKCLLVK